MALLFDISSYLSDLLFSTPVETPAPPNVHIVPCSAVDLSFGRKERVLTLSLVIDTCLDAPTLEQTLSTLVVHKFPRAGARLVLRNEVSLSTNFVIIASSITVPRNSSSTSRALLTRTTRPSRLPRIITASCTHRPPGQTSAVRSPTPPTLRRRCSAHSRRWRCIRGARHAL